MKTDWIVGFITLMCFSMIGYMGYLSIKLRDIEYAKQSVGVVVAKQSEQESINNMGDFRTNYYVLLESGELLDVELKEYMEINKGDTLTYYDNSIKN